MVNYCYSHGEALTKLIQSVQMYGYNMFSQLTSLISMKCSFTKGCLIVTGLMGLSMDTLRKQNWTESS